MSLCPGVESAAAPRLPVFLGARGLEALVSSRSLFLRSFADFAASETSSTSTDVVVISSGGRCYVFEDSACIVGGKIGKR